MTVDNGKEKLQQLLGCPLVYCDYPGVTLHIEVYLTSGKHRNKKSNLFPRARPELWMEASLEGSSAQLSSSFHQKPGGSTGNSNSSTLSSVSLWEPTLIHCLHWSLPSLSFPLKIRRKPSYLPLMWILLLGGFWARKTFPRADCFQVKPSRWIFPGVWDSCQILQGQKVPNSCLAARDPSNVKV